MVFFAPDYEAYERERGFYFDYRTGVPGPIFETTEALADYLRAGDFDLERVARLPRRPPSTSPTEAPQHASRTRSSVPSLTRAADPTIGLRSRAFTRLGVPYRGPPSPASADHVTGSDRTP